MCSLQGAFAALTAVLVESSAPAMHVDVLQAMCNLTAIQPVTPGVSPTSTKALTVSNDLVVPNDTLAAVTAFACSAGTARLPARV